MSTSCNHTPIGNSITRVQMDLSSFGVESESFPSIHANIDLISDTGYCTKIYDSSKYKDSAYALTASEIQQINKLIEHVNLESFKKHYTTDKSDQPKSTIIIYANNKKYVIEDYGLVGENPLQDLYKIVYKLNF